MGCVGIVGGVGIVVADCCKGWHQVLVLVLLGWCVLPAHHAHHHRVGVGATTAFHPLQVNYVGWCWW